MPSVDYFGDARDDELLAGWFLMQGWVLAPDINYETERYETLFDLGEVRPKREQTRMFFLIRRDISAEPLEMHRVQRPEGERFFIMPRNGGPALHWLCSGEFLTDDQELIAPGSLWAYPTYWSPLRGENVRAPVALLEALKRARAYFRANYLVHKAKSRTYHIGRGAYARMLKGAKLVGLETLDASALLTPVPTKNPI